MIERPRGRRYDGPIEANLASAPPDPATRRVRVLTGYRPTGPLHVGHWFGNIQKMLELQETHDAFFFVADWHALTTDFDRTEHLPETIRDLVLDWLAAGLDPSKATIYLQSRIPEVAEMTLLLGMITPLGWLERVPTYKERLRDLAERDIANYGLLGYPLLQTTDIAIVKGEVVPVGEDQVPHLELSREIVRRFNALYGPVLVEPAALLSEAPRIPGTDGRKMSSSLGNDIRITDPPDAMTKKVKNMVTDPQKIRLGDRGRPEVCPVYGLHRMFSADIIGQTEAGCRAGTLPCVTCKSNLAERMVAYFRPFHERRDHLDPKEAGAALEAGHDRVRPVVEETMEGVRTAMHLTP
ncbi:MAG: tryptophan--tRNA ligase [Actinomycetota bacterium]|nr:tryptophan--tRNA ligase [Actinomycetota bacterium]